MFRQKKPTSVGFDAACIDKRSQAQSQAAVHAQPSARSNRASVTSSMNTPWNTSVSDPATRHSGDCPTVERSNDIEAAEATMHAKADSAVERMLAAHQVLPLHLLYLPAVTCEARVQ